MSSWSSKLDRLFRDLDELFREIERDIKERAVSTVSTLMQRIREKGETILREVEETVTKLDRYRMYSIYREVIYSRGAPPPRYELRDLGDEIQLVVDLPGCEKENIKVRYDDRHGTLIIEAKRDKDITYTLEITLDIDPETIRATYRNGVLTVQARKAERKLREVKIE